MNWRFWNWGKQEEPVTMNDSSRTESVDLKEMQELQEMQKKFTKTDLDTREVSIKSIQAQVDNVRYLFPLAEMRLAMSQGQFKDSDTGIGERTPVEPMFEELDRKRLQKRYLLVLDHYITDILKLNIKD